MRELTVNKERSQEYGLILSYEQSDGLVQIIGINPGSPSDRIGKICVGDKIWAINYKRMQGKTLPTLKVVENLIKVFASSIRLHLISNQFNGEYISNTKILLRRISFIMFNSRETIGKLTLILRVQSCSNT